MKTGSYTVTPDRPSAFCLDCIRAGRGQVRADKTMHDGGKQINLCRLHHMERTRNQGSKIYDDPEPVAEAVPLRAHSIERAADALRSESKGNGVASMPKPKQQRLPGTGEAAINKLEEMAQEYQECGERRKQLKLNLLEEMKVQKKKHYEHNGLEITIVDGTEGVRVKITRYDEGDEPGE